MSTNGAGQLQLRLEHSESSVDPDEFPEGVRVRVSASWQMEPPQVLTVEGNTSEPGLNGEYHIAGEFRRGKKQWMKRGSRCYIRWIRDRWELYVSHHPNGTTYFFNSTDTQVPPTTGWIGTDYVTPAEQLVVQDLALSKNALAGTEAKSSPVELTAPATNTCRYVLFTNRTCPFAQRVHIAIHELGTSVQRECIDILAQDSASYVRFCDYSGRVLPSKNARPAIPLLVASGDGRENILFDSEIIVRYLDELEGGQLDGRSPSERALLRMFVAAFRREIEPCIHRIKRSRDLTELQVAADSMMKAFHCFEQVCVQSKRAASAKDGPFLFGSRFSLAEVLTAPHLQRLVLIVPHLRPQLASLRGVMCAHTGSPIMSALRKKFPALMGWVLAVLSRASVRESFNLEETEAVMEKAVPNFHSD